MNYEIGIHIPGVQYYRGMYTRANILDLANVLIDIVAGSNVDATEAQIAQCVREAIVCGKSGLNMNQKAKPFITIRECAL